MIEFKGEISGLAESFFWRKSRKIAQNILLVIGIIVLAVVLIIAISYRYWELVLVYGVIAVCCYGLTMIPPTKKKKNDFNPKRIFTDEEYIVCIGNKYEEYKLISDVTTLNDYGEFYELVFPFGQISDKFICQKDLLTQGTLEEFEALFEGKIVDKRK